MTDHTQADPDTRTAWDDKVATFADDLEADAKRYLRTPFTREEVAKMAYVCQERLDRGMWTRGTQEHDNLRTMLRLICTLELRDHDTEIQIAQAVHDAKQLVSSVPSIEDGGCDVCDDPTCYRNQVND